MKWLLHDRCTHLWPRAADHNISAGHTGLPCTHRYIEPGMQPQDQATHIFMRNDRDVSEGIGIVRILTSGGYSGGACRKEQSEVIA